MGVSLVLGILKKHYFSNGSNILLGYGDIKLSKGDVKLFTPMSKIQSCLLWTDSELLIFLVPKICFPVI